MLLGRGERTRVAGQPGIRNQREEFIDQRFGDLHAERLASGADVVSARKQHVILDHREAAHRHAIRVVPGMVHVERGAVIDHPEFVMPDEQVRILGRAIDVHDERVEPDDRGGQRSIDTARASGLVGDRPRQVIEREVQAAAGSQQSLQLGVRLSVCKRGVEFNENDLRYRQSERPAEFAADQFRHQHR